MNNTTSENQDQAEELRAIFSEVMNNEQELEEETVLQINSEENEERKEVDILNLPPRKEIHGNSNGKLQFKISLPFVRMLLVSLVAIGIVVFVIWSEEILELLSF